MTSPTATPVASVAAEGDVRYAAVASRDPRFDGRFFTAVLTTGIYCRPSCPARTPMRRNVRFYTEAAGAEVDGFRACKRCRPDRAPDSPDVDVRGDLVGRALRLVNSGAVDDGGVSGLARLLHVSERHLLRSFTGELGAGPQAVARSRRIRLARSLLETSGLPVSEVAFASGFGSIRQFNDAVRAATGLTPSAIRAVRPPHESGLAMRLSYRSPYDVDLALRWVAGHVVPGVEEVVGRRWRRTVQGGVVELTPQDGHWLLRAEVEDSRVIGRVARSARRVLDLDADPQAIAGTLGGHPALGPLVDAKPGLRCLGSWDAFEGIARVIVGQQVSVRGGATLAGRLAVAAGTPLTRPTATLTHVFPTAAQVATADLSGVGLTRARLAALTGVARAADAGDVPLDGSATPTEILSALAAIKGIGPWTLSCVAMRVLRDPDAWPVGDLVLRRACAAHGIDPDHDDGPLRPWRAYAATYLWEDTWTAPA